MNKWTDLARQSEQKLEAAKACLAIDVERENALAARIDDALSMLRKGCVSIVGEYNLGVTSDDLKIRINSGETGYSFTVQKGRNGPSALIARRGEGIEVTYLNSTYLSSLAGALHSVFHRISRDGATCILEEQGIPAFDQIAEKHCEWVIRASW